jgi:hypothetical protein
MDREWKIDVIGAYLTAVVNNDANGLSAVIGGEIVGAPQAGGSDLPPQTMGNERYGPVTVRAQSLGELKWAVEEKIEEDIGRVIKWSGL